MIAPALHLTGAWLRRSLLLVGVLVPAAMAQTATHPILLIVNKADRTVVTFDPATGAKLATIPTGGTTAHEIAASPDGRFAFAPIYGNSGVGKPGTDGDSIAVIDLASGSVSQTIKFPHGVRPHLPVYDASHNLLYVTTELDQTVTAIDPKTLAIVSATPTGRPQSHMLAISHDGTRGYTTNVAAGTVSVLDFTTHRQLAEVPVASNIQRISISNDDKMVFTSDTVKPELDVISTASNKVVRRLPLPSFGFGSVSMPDGRLLLVTMPAINQVAVIDLQKMSIVRTIPVCAAPQEIVVEPGKPDTAWTSCMSSGQIIAFHPMRGTAEQAIGVGNGTDGLTWAMVTR